MKLAALLVLALAGCGHSSSGTAADASGSGGGSDATGGGTDASAASDALAVDAAAAVDAAYVPADPFTVDASCPAMTFAQLVAYFPPGGTSASAGAFTLRTRARASCNTVTGCSAWVDPSPVELQQIFDRAGYPSGTGHALPATGSMELRLDPSAMPPSISLELAASEPGTSSNTIRFRCDQVRQGGVADTLDCSAQVEFSSDYPSLLWFVDTYAGGPLFDNTTMLEWHGRICSDGHYQLVTKLATELGTSVSGANNRNQIAIYGQL